MDADVQVRLIALEYVTSMTVAQVYLLAGFSPEAAEELRLQAQERLSLQSLTKLPDPALSDLRSAEIADAVNRLLMAATSMLRGMASPQSP